MTALRTPLCDLLGVDYPIVQSGMGSAAGPELAAEVSRAGGLGIVAGLGVTADEMRRRIRHVRSVTDRPFGVNQWLHTDLMPPVDPTRVPESTMRAVQSQLNVFRARLGVATTDARAPAFPDLIEDAFAVVLEERVPVWSIGLGNPTPDMVRRCHERGVKTVAVTAGYMCDEPRRDARPRRADRRRRGRAGDRGSRGRLRRYRGRGRPDGGTSS